MCRTRLEREVAWSDSRRRASATRAGSSSRRSDLGAHAPPGLLLGARQFRRCVDLLHDRGRIEGLCDTIDDAVGDEAPAGGAARDDCPRKRVRRPHRGECGPGDHALPEETQAKLRTDEGRTKETTSSTPHAAGKALARGSKRPQRVESPWDAPTSSGVRASVESMASTMKVIVKASVLHSACARGVPHAGCVSMARRWRPAISGERPNAVNPKRRRCSPRPHGEWSRGSDRVGACPAQHRVGPPSDHVQDKGRRRQEAELRVGCSRQHLDDDDTPMGVPFAFTDASCLAGEGVVQQRGHLHAQ
eukprot:1714249-Prymnesium_polylepis.1